MSWNVHSRWQLPNSKLQLLKRSFKIATTETMPHSQISASKNSRIPKLQLSHCKIATPETMPRSKLFACVFEIETPKTMPYSKISACAFQIEAPALQELQRRTDSVIALQEFWKTKARHTHEFILGWYAKEPPKEKRQKQTHKNCQRQPCQLEAQLPSCRTCPC